MKKEIDDNKKILGDLNTMHSTMDRSFRGKISKKTDELNYTLEEIEPTDLYRTFYPTESECTFFSSAHWNIFQDRLYVRWKNKC